MPRASSVRKRSPGTLVRDVLWVSLFVLIVAVAQMAAEDSDGEWGFKLALAGIATAISGGLVALILLTMVFFERQPKIVRKLQKEFSQRYARALEASPFNPAYSRNSE